MDRTITTPEISILKEEVRSNWLAVEDSADPFGSDAAFQIETVFDWLSDERYDATEAFRSFRDFAVEHTDFLAQPMMKQRILNSANRIAEAFYGTNKLELDLLDQLETLLT